MDGEGGRTSIPAEQIVEFLLSRNYLLTALELLQEASEAGLDRGAVARLQAVFRDPDLFPPEAVAECNPEGASTFVSVAHQRQQELSLSQHELAVTREELHTLRQQLSAAGVGGTDGGPGAGVDAAADTSGQAAAAGSGSSMDGQVPVPPPQHQLLASQLAALHRGVLAHLQQQGYRLAAMSLAKEAGLAAAAVAPGTAAQLPRWYLDAQQVGEEVERRQQLERQVDEQSSQLASLLQQLEEVRGKEQAAAAELEFVRGKLRAVEQQQQQQQHGAQQAQQQAHQHHQQQQPRLQLDPMGAAGALAEVAACMPQVLPAVLINKRDELVPALVALCQEHPDPAARRQLAGLLFNLIKKPNAAQRCMIVSACVLLVERIGGPRAMLDLMPHLSNQADQELVERRLLVAEAVGALAPLLPRPQAAPAVLKLLGVLLQDGQSQVRCQALGSLAQLAAQGQGAGMLSQSCAPAVLRILLHAAGDASADVVQQLLQTALPAVLSWVGDCVELLTAQLLPQVLAELQSRLGRCPAAAGMADMPAQGDPPLLRTVPAAVQRQAITLLQVFSATLPAARALALRTQPAWVTRAVDAAVGSAPQHGAAGGGATGNPASSTLPSWGASGSTSGGSQLPQPRVPESGLPNPFAQALPAGQQQDVSRLAAAVSSSNNSSSLSSSSSSVSVSSSWSSQHWQQRQQRGPADGSASASSGLGSPQLAVARPSVAAIGPNPFAKPGTAADLWGPQAGAGPAFPISSSSDGTLHLPPVAEQVSGISNGTISSIGSLLDLGQRQQHQSFGASLREPPPAVAAAALAAADDPAAAARREAAAFAAWVEAQDGLQEWALVEYMAVGAVPALAKAALMVAPSQDAAVLTRSFVAALKATCLSFGEAFSAWAVAPQLEAATGIPGSSREAAASPTHAAAAKQQPQGQGGPALQALLAPAGLLEAPSSPAQQLAGLACALPLLLAGCLPYAGVAAVGTCLRRLCTPFQGSIFALDRPRAFISAVRIAAEVREVQAQLVPTIWTLVASKEQGCRLAAALLAGAAAPALPSQQVMRQLLPAITMLASDEDGLISRAGIAAASAIFGAWRAEQDLQDALFSNLDSCLIKRGHPAEMDLLAALAPGASSATSQQLEWLLQRVQLILAAMHQRSSSGKTPAQLAEAAAEAFIALRQIEAHEFTEQRVHMHFLAALTALQLEADLLEPSQCDALAAMIEDHEVALASNSSAGSTGAVMSMKPRSRGSVLPVDATVESLAHRMEPAHAAPSQQEAAPASRRQLAALFAAGNTADADHPLSYYIQ